MNLEEIFPPATDDDIAADLAALELVRVSPEGAEEAGRSVVHEQHELIAGEAAPGTNRRSTQRIGRGYRTPCARSRRGVRRCVTSSRARRSIWTSADPMRRGTTETYSRRAQASSTVSTVAPWSAFAGSTP